MRIFLIKRAFRVLFWLTLFADLIETAIRILTFNFWPFAVSFRCLFTIEKLKFHIMKKYNIKSLNV